LAAREWVRTTKTSAFPGAYDDNDSGIYDPNVYGTRRSVRFSRSARAESLFSRGRCRC
jgi:hypothetical protein